MTCNYTPARLTKQGRRTRAFRLSKVCHMYGTKRGVIADNSFTISELANFLLTTNVTSVGTVRENTNVTSVGTVRENKPEIHHYFTVENSERLIFYIWLYN
jgi:hypothetical protein